MRNSESSSVADSPETVNSLRTGLLVRALALAKLALNTRTELLREANFSQLESDPALRDQLESQAKAISRELGLLKGSAMKVGQLLSVFGEHFLPPQVNSVLKLLQSNSPPLEWQILKPTVQSELREVFDELEIDVNSVAAASIGQVHRAKIKATGELIALKIQYPKVERAIENDLRTLKTMLMFAPVQIKGDRTSKLLTEIEEMLARETDYRHEADNYLRFKNELNSDPRFIVPRVHTRYSTSRILALDYMSGYRIDSGDVAELSQERRNRLGQALLDLYLRELFFLGRVQTDAHIGNYLVSISADPDSTPDKIILLDFGATRDFPDNFLQSYASLVRATLAEDRETVTKMGIDLGFLKPCDPGIVHDEFFQFCRLMVEPFHKVSATYCWSENDLPKRLAAQLNRVIQAREFRPPPREALFLDRKSMGLFCLLSKLKATTTSRDLLETAIEYRLEKLAQGAPPAASLTRE